MANKEVFFMQENVAKVIIEQLGWKTEKFISFPNGVALNPNFYPTGWCIAKSNKATITSQGYMQIIIDGKTYDKISTIIEDFGEPILESILDWEWVATKEWVIVDNYGDWVKSFDNFYKCPFRTLVKC